MDEDSNVCGSIVLLKKDGKAGSSYPLVYGDTTFGSSIDADVRIKTNQPDLESTHCIIYVNDSGIAKVINKSDLVPVKVNDVPVTSERVLNHEDIIEVVGKLFQYVNENLDVQDIEVCAKESQTSKRQSVMPLMKPKKSPSFKTKIPQKRRLSSRRSVSGTRDFMVSVTPEKKPDLHNILEKAKTTSKVLISKAIGSPSLRKQRLSLGNERKPYGKIPKVSARTVLLSEQYVSSTITEENEITSPPHPSTSMVRSENLNKSISFEESVFERSPAKSEKTPKTSVDGALDKKDPETSQTEESSKTTDDYLLESNETSDQNTEETEKLDAAKSRKTPRKSLNNYSLHNLSNDESLNKSIGNVKSPRTEEKSIAKSRRTSRKSLENSSLLEMSMSDIETPQKSSGNLHTPENVEQRASKYGKTPNKSLANSLLEMTNNETPQKSTRNLKTSKPVEMSSKKSVNDSLLLELTKDKTPTRAKINLKTPKTAQLLASGRTPIHKKLAALRGTQSSVKPKGFSPIKRSKNLTDISNIEANKDMSPLVTSTPAKRGRPRKVTVTPQTEIADSVILVDSPAKRGRPRKETDTPQTEITDSVILVDSPSRYTQSLIVNVDSTHEDIDFSTVNESSIRKSLCNSSINASQPLEDSPCSLENEVQTPVAEPVVTSRKSQKLASSIISPDSHITANNDEIDSTKLNNFNSSVNKEETQSPRYSSAKKILKLEESLTLENEDILSSRKSSTRKSQQHASPVKESTSVNRRSINKQLRESFSENEDLEEADEKETSVAKQMFSSTRMSLKFKSPLNEDISKAVRILSRKSKKLEHSLNKEETQSPRYSSAKKFLKLEESLKLENEDVLSSRKSSARKSQKYASPVKESTPVNRRSINTQLKESFSENEDLEEADEKETSVAKQNWLSSSRISLKFESPLNEDISKAVRTSSRKSKKLEHSLNCSACSQVTPVNEVSLTRKSLKLRKSVSSENEEKISGSAGKTKKLEESINMSTKETPVTVQNSRKSSVRMSQDLQKSIVAEDTTPNNVRNSNRKNKTFEENFLANQQETPPNDPSARFSSARKNLKLQQSLLENEDIEDRKSQKLTSSNKNKTPISEQSSRKSSMILNEQKSISLENVTLNNVRTSSRKSKKLEENLNSSENRQETPVNERSARFSSSRNSLNLQESLDSENEDSLHLTESDSSNNISTNRKSKNLKESLNSLANKQETPTNDQSRRISSARKSLKLNESTNNVHLSGRKSGTLEESSQENNDEDRSYSSTRKSLKNLESLSSDTEETVKNTSNVRTSVRMSNKLNKSTTNSDRKSKLLSEKNDVSIASSKGHSRFTRSSLNKSTSEESFDISGSYTSQNENTTARISSVNKKTPRMSHSSARKSQKHDQSLDDSLFDISLIDKDPGSNDNEDILNLSVESSKHSTSRRSSLVNSKSLETPENKIKLNNSSVKSSTPVVRRSSLRKTIEVITPDNKSEDATEDLETPKSAIKPRRSRSFYNPPTEEITPVTPEPKNHNSDNVFKTPINTPGLFESLRKSALNSRKRARESTGSVFKSSKKLRMDHENIDNSKYETNTSLNISSSSGSSKSETELQNTPDVKNTLKPKSPLNDLTDVRGVKRLLKTPKVVKLPKNDLSDVRGVKNLLATPRNMKSPKNDLTNVAGVKKLLSTPRIEHSPKNDLTNIPNLRKLMSPKDVKSPKNDLRQVPNLRRIFSPKEENSPKNDLTKIPNLRRIMSPKNQNSPVNDLRDVQGLKKLMATPKAMKEPLNDLSDVEGVANIFNMSGVEVLGHGSDIENYEDLFEKVAGVKALRTYRGKSISPKKYAYQNVDRRKTVGDATAMSPRIEKWVKEQVALGQQDISIEKIPKKRGRKKVVKDDIPVIVNESLEKSPKDVNEESYEPDEQHEAEHIVKSPKKRGRKRIIKVYTPVVVNKESHESDDKLEEKEESLEKSPRKRGRKRIIKVDTPVVVINESHESDDKFEEKEESLEKSPKKRGRKRSIIVDTPVDLIEESHESDASENLKSPKKAKGKAVLSAKVKETTNKKFKSNSVVDNIKEEIVISESPKRSARGKNLINISKEEIITPEPTKRSRRRAASGNNDTPESVNKNAKTTRNKRILSHTDIDEIKEDSFIPEEPPKRPRRGAATIQIKESTSMPEVATIAKTSRAKKMVAEAENIIEDTASPVKRSRRLASRKELEVLAAAKPAARNRPKAAVADESETEQEIEKEPLKKTLRGKNKEATEVDEETPSAKPASRQRKKAVAVEEPEKDEVIEKVLTKRKLKGKNKEMEVDEKTPQTYEESERKDLAEAECVTSAEKNKGDVEEKTAKPTSRNKRKVAVVKEDREEIAEKEPVKKRQRGQKEETVKGNELEKDILEEPVKKTVRGKKKVAFAETGKEDSEIVESPKKKPIKKATKGKKPAVEELEDRKPDGTDEILTIKAIARGKKQEIIESDNEEKESKVPTKRAKRGKNTKDEVFEQNNKDEEIKVSAKKTEKKMVTKKDMTEEVEEVPIATKRGRPKKVQSDSQETFKKEIVIRKSTRTRK